MEKEEEVDQLKKNLTKVTTMIPELMICHSPSLIYEVFLKEQLLNFQMTCVLQDKSPSLDEPQDFF